MSFRKKLNEYPLVLWALSFYLCSLSFGLRVDIPLALFSGTAVMAFVQGENSIHFRDIWRNHWQLLFFLFTIVLATSTSANIRHSLYVQMHFIPALLVYLVIIGFVNSLKDLQFIFVSIVCAALIAAVHLCIATILASQADPMEKVIAIKNPLFTVPNDTLFLAVLSPFALVQLLQPGPKWIKGFSALYLFLTAMMAVYLQSRQAVGVFVISIVVFFALSRPVKALVIGTAITAVVLLVDWMMGGGLLSKLVILFPRRYVWDAAWNMFLDHPWLGFGPGEFKDNYYTYLEKAGYVFDQIEDRRPMKWAHSLYLEQLAERGVMGLLALLVFIIGAVTRLLKANDMGKISSLSMCVLSAIIAIFISGVAETSLLRLWSVTSIFCIVAVSYPIVLYEKNYSIFNSPTAVGGSNK